MTQERWQQLVSTSTGGPVTPGTMFGSKGLRTGTKFYSIWWHEQLVVKLPAARIDELTEAAAGVPFEPAQGRRMNGWIVLTSDTDWPALATEARLFVESQQT